MYGLPETGATAGWLKLSSYSPWCILFSMLRAADIAER
jgi:hypothetical protein